jgi:hypothetical protein
MFETVDLAYDTPDLPMVVAATNAAFYCDGFPTTSVAVLHGVNACAPAHLTFDPWDCCDTNSCDCEVFINGVLRSEFPEVFHRLKRKARQLGVVVSAQEGLSHKVIERIAIPGTNFGKVSDAAA